MIIKILKWSGLSILLLLLIMFAVYYYLIFSFDTENFPENHGKVHTQLYLGEGTNQPLIVGLGGSEGGNAWASDHWKSQREQYIADGYAFLALGYFGMSGIPAELDRISLDGVHQAILNAANDPKINNHCIALIGGSKGAELSLVLASIFPDIKAVVALVPGHAVFPSLTLAMTTSSFTYKDQQLPFVPVPWSATPSLITGDLRGVWALMLKDTEAVEKAAITVENINGPVFLISATKDEMWPSKEMSDQLIKRLESKNFPYYFKHLAIEGDHAAPLDHFDQINNFLQVHFMQNNANNCLSNILGQSQIKKFKI